ncbi:uncharacterized protein MYCFIDRAFT_205641 [Pseudocercospora fijiensis CIRAD86]|uniref:Uncharacterized protein n=1 Tax=Pseudocercospora fijiensis (strain CIRAD86) TaxID=383855 RepID=N1Q8X6_PSEFD|nr:uncharacterized protein MYCFIDRAFT_205641 [Pseudocercospora fijiensis CIRAD86]EME87338.1 hypothetical protein MYCFIDRAFT_205641 [Pseudocercospora fijiensis CIRAD86]
MCAAEKNTWIRRVVDDMRCGLCSAFNGDGWLPLKDGDKMEDGRTGLSRGHRDGRDDLDICLTGWTPILPSVVVTGSGAGAGRLCSRLQTTHHARPGSRR